MFFHLISMFFHVDALPGSDKMCTDNDFHEFNNPKNLYLNLLQDA